MRIGDIILNGRYELVDRAGAGGMAQVFKARDLILGRTVAVKILHPNFTNDAQFLRKFYQEAQSVGNLTHPNIVTLHDIGQDENGHYIIMEYVEGRNLKDLILEQTEKNQPLEIDRTLNLIIQICEGIGYAHRANLIHCDIKPQNLLITPDDQVKVADFGISRAIEHTHTTSEHIWGTPQYLSPEQAAGEPSSPASDVYAIGVILFELLTNRLPFNAANPAAIALKHLQEQPPLVRELNPTVPETLSQIVDKILTKEPSGRYRTAHQLGRILDSYRANAHEATMPLHLHQQPAPIPSAPIQQKVTHLKEESFPPVAPTTLRTDWPAVTLSIIALIALLGLIPLWYSVYLAWVGA